MKQLPAYLLLISLLMSSSLLAGQIALLQYQLQEGAHYNLDIEISQNTHSESINREELNMYSHLVLDFRADSMSQEGSIHFTVNYSKLHLSVLSPALGLDIDSQSAKNTLLGELLKELEKHSFSLSISKYGEVGYFGGLETFFQDKETDSTMTGPALSSLEEAYGPHSFENLLGLFISYFPTVQPISNWTRNLTYYFNTKPVKMINRYQQVKATEQAITVQGIGMINSMEPYEEVLSLGKVESSVSGSHTYDYSVDANSGWLRKCMSRQRVVIETRIVESSSLPANLKIPSYTETVFEVKGFGPSSQEK